MNANQINSEFRDVLLNADYKTIQLFSTRSTEYLCLFRKLFKLEEIHRFCAKVDVYLHQNDIEPIGVHCQLNDHLMSDIMYRLRDLGLWQIYVDKQPLESCIDIICEKTLPQLAQSSASSDMDNCGFCWQKQSFRT